MNELISNPLATLKQMTQQKIEALIKRLDKAYFVAGEGLVPDSVYDIVRRYYAKHFPQGSVLNKIGQKAKADAKLEVPMASLNQYEVGSSQLKKALQQGPFCVTDKLDGLSVEVVYSGGVPVRAFRRGDAEYGTDISVHIPNMKIPKRVTDDLVVRFEAVIPQQSFQTKLHKDVGGEYKAARNAASGILSQAKPNAGVKHIDFVAFEILRGKGAGQPQSRQLRYLNKIGMKVVIYKVFQKLTEQQLIDYLDERVRESDYEIDGLVVAQDTVYKHSGASNPKHAFKFKMNAESSMVLTRCTGVTYQKSKFGALTPVVNFEPVQLAAGATCSKATGHNGFYIQNGFLKGEDKPVRPIGKGAVLKVVRSGSVIPYIVEVVKGARKPDLPDVPYKVSGVDFILEGKISDHISVQTARIDFFLQALGVRELGSKSIQKILESGTRTGVAGLYDFLRTSTKDLAPALGIARSRTARAELDKLFTVGARPEQLFSALSPWYIEGMGESNWQKVLPTLPSIKDISSLSPQEVNARISEVTSVKSMHQRLSKAIPRMAQVILKMKLKVKEVKTSGDKFAGQTVLMTGFRDSALKEKLIEQGATVAGSYTKSVTVVVAADVNDSSSKLQKARADGKRIISRAQLEKVLGW